MQYTNKLGLKKPELTDYVNIADINENMDILDQEIAKISDPETGVEAIVTQHLDNDASLTKKGHTQLSSATNSVDETKAATPKAVKDAMDKANNAIPLTQKGKPNGVAILDVSGNIPEALLSKAPSGYRKIIEVDLVGKTSILFNSGLSGFKNFSIVVKNARARSGQPIGKLTLNGANSGYSYSMPTISSSIGAFSNLNDFPIGYYDSYSDYFTFVEISLKGSIAVVESISTNIKIPGQEIVAGLEGRSLIGIQNNVVGDLLNTLQYSLSEDTFSAGTIELWGAK